MSGWTDERRERVKMRWLENASASRIAMELAEGDFRPSKNSIVGLLDRMGVKRTSGAQIERRPCAPKASQVAPPPPPVRIVSAERSAAPPPRPEPVVTIPRERLHAPGPRSATLAKLPAGACRFPVGPHGGADQLFCGEACGEASYCAPHARLAVARQASAA